MRNLSIVARTAAAAAGAVLVLSACGGNPTASSSGGGGDQNGGGQAKAEKLYAQTAGLSRTERRDKLVKQAQEEGQLNLYTSMTSDVADAVSEAFTDAYDVDVNLYRAASETVL